MLFELAIFAAIAGFVLFRLYMVLGRRVGRQAPPPGAQAGPQPASARADAKAVEDASGDPAFADRPRPAFTGPGAAGMEAIRRADGGFTPESFLAGARGAYEMIVQAFAEGERETLRRFLAPSVYERYEAAIAEREAKGLVQTTDIVRLSDVKIQDAELDNRIARIRVAFRADLSTVTRNAEGAIVEGDPARTRAAHEVWTFERDTRARDPNWILAKVSRA